MLSLATPKGGASCSDSISSQRSRDGSEADAPPSPRSNEAGEEDDFYGDQEDAQSFIQPAISPSATRLISPKTPAAEKAAAMDRVPGGGLFPIVDEAEPSSQRAVPSLSVLLEHPDQMGKAGEGGDETWPASPPSGSRQETAAAVSSASDVKAQEVIVPEKKPPAKSPISGMFSGHSRRRSHSVGENALRRLSKALPSINISSNLLPNISTPSFFSTSSPQKEDSAAASRTPKLPSDDNTQRPRLPARTNSEFRGLQTRSLVAPCSPGTGDGQRQTGLQRPPSGGARRSLRRSTSEDSILHTLTPVSSFGDDERFTNIREQVNVRFKAIRDSWDGPSFKLPQLPNILSTPLRKGANWPNGTMMTTATTTITRSSSLRAGPRVQSSALSPLDAVLESLTGDIVIMGGYRGSVLRSSQTPFRQLWVPVKVGLNIRRVNLEVGLNPEDEEAMESQIFPSGMLRHIGPVDISRRLFKKLRECENARKGKLRVHDYGYDWRLSPHLLSRKLVEFLERLPSNHPSTPRDQRGALVLAHSLGGLITRHAVNQRPEIFSGVLFAGTPQRCINVLGPLRNGDAVLLNEKVLTAQVNFSMRTTFAFLPEDGFCFIDKVTQEEYRIDFHNVEDWIKYRLSPCVGGPSLPPAASKGNNTFGSLRSFSESLSSLPLRGRANSDSKKAHSPSRNSISEAVRSGGGGGKAEAVSKDRTLAPQISSSSSHHSVTTPPASQTTAPDLQPPSPPGSPASEAARARNVAYLRRTLAETKQFRAELAHRAAHSKANAYPPLAVMYGKDTPTVWAARVAGREAIACADAYDDLVFRSGDGVVLAREASLPPGYEAVRGGRVSTDHGHITMLGDLTAVGKALEAVVRGRRKGVGLGPDVGVGGKQA